MAERTSTHAGIDLALILGFLAVLAAPGLVFLVAHDADARAEELRERERRGRPYPAPELRLATLETWPRTVDAWWPQQLGLRPYLLHLRSGLLWEGLGAFPGTRMVRGADDWLFLARGAFQGVADDFLDGWRGARPLDEATLDVWTELFAERAAWARARGIPHLVVVAPQKAAIYPEHVPPRYPRVGPGRWDQLRPRLAAAGVEVLDLRDVFAAARENDTFDPVDHLYHPTGTHWSRRGDALAYATLVRRLAELGAELGAPWSTYEEQPFLDDRDSWERRAYLDGRLPRMRTEWFPVGAPDVRKTRVPGTRRGQRLIGPDTGRRLVVVHDSFGLHVRESLAWHGHVTALRSYDFDAGRLEAAHPDAIVEFYVDRVFSQHDPRLLRMAGAPAGSGPVVWTDDTARPFDVDGRGGRVSLEGLPSDVARPVLELVVDAPGPGGVTAIGFASDLRRNPIWEGPAGAVGDGDDLVRLVLPPAALAEGQLDLWFEGPVGSWTLQSARLVAEERP